MKVAVVGLGSAARTIHLPAIAKLPEIEVVGACDPAAKEAPAGLELFADLEAMLSTTRPDVLVVATPPDSHFALCRRALAAGCHVVCEKPFVESLDEAREIAALAKERGRHVVVNNQYRFMRIHEEAKRRIGSREFGDLLFVLAQQSFVTSEATESGWRGQGTRRTCKEFGTHVLDLCRFFFGEEPARLRARMPSAGRAGTPDHLNIIELDFSKDRVACIVLDRLSRGPHRYLDIRLDGSEGCIETSIGGGVELSMGLRGGSRKPFLALDVTSSGKAVLHGSGKKRRIARDPLDLFASATRKLYAALLSAIETGGTPPCDAADNAKTLALMLAAYESHERGTAIDLDPGRDAR